MQETILSPAETIVQLVNLQTRLFNNAVAGIGADDAEVRMNDNVNHFKWITGHLISTRYMLVNLLGVKAEEPHADLFGKGKGIDTEIEYPPVSELLQGWTDVSPVLLDAVRGLSAEALAADAPMDLPIADRTLLGVLTFFMHHEAYHIGQMGILRKFLGHESMSYR